MPEGFVQSDESIRNLLIYSFKKTFHCKVEKHGENAHLRQKGKIAELALGDELKK